MLDEKMKFCDPNNIGLALLLSLEIGPNAFKVHLVYLCSRMLLGNAVDYKSIQFALYFLFLGLKCF